MAAPPHQPPSKPPAWASTIQPSPGRTLTSFAPTAVFLAINAVGDVVPAMIGASMVATVVVAMRRRYGDTIGVAPFVALAYVVTRGVAGVASGSEDVFFGFGVATSGLLAVAVLASAFTSRPAAVYVLPLFVRYLPHTVRHPTYGRVAAHVTAVWALAELAVSAWEGSHLSETTATEFIWLRTVVGWPAMAAVVFVLIAYVRFRLDPLEHRLGDGGNVKPADNAA